MKGAWGSEAGGEGETITDPKVRRCRLNLSNRGQGESLVPLYTRESVSLSLSLLSNSS